MTRTGVVLTAFGGPDCIDAVEPFMCSIMGRQPSAEAVSEARERYEAIGGGSPLPAMAARIADSLERDLSSGGDVPVAVGMLHSHPTIASAVDALVEAGVERVISLSLSPFDAAATTGAYSEALVAAASTHPGLVVTAAAGYNRSDPFVTALAQQARAILGGWALADTLVVFTAHSLPVADLEADPAYVVQLRETAEAVAVATGLGLADGFSALPGVEAFGGHGGSVPWLLAFQSKGRRGGAWAGPDLDAIIAAAAASGLRGVVILPIGFAADHMETLYDLDVVAAQHAVSLGLGFARAMAPNDSEKMIEALADSVRAAI